MSLSFQELPPRTEVTRLKQRVDRLRASMDWASEAIDPSVRDEVLAAIVRSDERLSLGVDHTIVALAGGTGGGKSSLFNALVGENLAKVSVARPTTAHVSAATWTQADALLDWLGVHLHRRHLVSRYPELRGVVLLDLPDHDSINETNRETVDAMIPLADLIVWVVDPQKYADHALHSAYVSAASEDGQPSIVVLNQSDRLAPSDVGIVVDDLRRLVEVEGLVGADVLAVSARTGDGVDALRAAIARAAESSTLAAQAVRADLVAAGRALERALARDAEPVMPDVDALVGSLARLAGVDAMADAAAQIVSVKPGGGSNAANAESVLPRPSTPLMAGVEHARLEWIDAATHSLPLPWRIVMNEAIVPAAVIAHEVEHALAAASWPEIKPRTGAKGLVSRATRGKAVADAVRAVGRRAIADAILPYVLAPTEMIHQAYRNLDELTELS